MRDTFTLRSDPVRHGWTITSFEHDDGTTGFTVDAGNCLDRTEMLRLIAALEAAVHLAEAMGGARRD